MFEKGSQEHTIFVDYWKICKKYGNLIKQNDTKAFNNDKFWKDMLADFEQFNNTYKEEYGQLAVNISLAAVDFFEAKYRRGKDASDK